MARRAAYTVFGRVLKDLTELEYGSQDALAMRLGQSPGWISQLLVKENLTYPALCSVLEAFPSLVHQEQLYKAWQKGIARAPLSVLFGEMKEDSKGVDQFLAEAPQLMEHGRARAVLAGANRVWERLRSDEEVASTAYAAARIAIDAALLLQRPVLAVTIANELFVIARTRQEPRWVAMALWLKAMAVERLSVSTSPEPERAFQALAEYLAVWQPRSREERDHRRDIERSWARDSLLCRVRQLGAQGLSDCRPGIEQHLRLLGTTIAEHDDLIAVGLAKEIEARILIGFGELDQAHDAIEQATAHFAFHEPMQAVKVGITKVRLLWAEGSRSNAEELLDKVLGIADTNHLMHYQSELRQLERDLWQGRLV